MMIGTYSLDKLVVLMRVEAGGLQRLLHSFDSGHRDDYGVISRQWFSARVGCYKQNFTIALDNDNTYYLGVQKWDDAPNEYRVNIKLEFNPNKVSGCTAFNSFYDRLLAICFWVEFGRFDIAIDIPVAREHVQLRKDQRRYLDYNYSKSNRTEYLGQRSEHGQVKVYNKAMEQGLMRDLTRVEITLDYDKASWAEFKRIFPHVFYLDPAAVGEGSAGTDYVLLLACMDDVNRLSYLPYRNRKKIERLLREAAQVLESDEIQFKTILHDILTFGKGFAAELSYVELEDTKVEFPDQFSFEQQKLRISQNPRE